MEYKRKDRQISRQLVIIFTIFAMAYFLTGICKADTIKVAVLDSGFQTSPYWKAKEMPKLCSEVINVVNSNKDDNYGHGTHITGLIHKYAGDADYCIYPIKFMDIQKKTTSGTKEVEQIKEGGVDTSIIALKKAIQLKVDIINYSAGGEEKSEEECELIKKALDMGIKVITAAGNESKNIGKVPYYPAKCDFRITVVESTDKQGRRLASSNFGGNTVKEWGERVMSICPHSYCIMTGTSQATAITTGKLVRRLDFYKRIKYNKNRGK